MALLPVPGLDPTIRGKWIRLSPQRRFVCDLMHFAQKVPTVPTQRRMHLADVVAARKASGKRISWCAIFMKAYAIVCRDHAVLRRCYLPWLWPHLYEHPITVASFMLEREYRGEDGVFAGQVREPEMMPIAELDRLVRWHKSVAFDEVPSFKRAMLLSRFPRPIRRFAWWMALCTDGACRAHFFGTFAISVVAQLGAASLHPLSPLTTTLNYGVFEPDGAIDVRLIYDHRVTDGAPIARAIVALEEVLHEQICPELLALPSADLATEKSADDGPVERSALAK